MRILYVYPGYIVREVPLNIMYISAATKQAGHQSDFFHFTNFKSKSFFQSTRELVINAFHKRMREFNPDVVAFSVMIQDYNLTCEMTYLSKNEYNKITIWGGIQAILEPEKCLDVKGLDYICAGEGEEVFPRFLDYMAKGKDIKDIEGIWHKKGKIVINNGRPNLIDNLDSLPFPDRELLEEKYYRAELSGANILTARGCPFPCSFCQNKELMRIYRGKGKFIRYRSLENVFCEMEDIIKKYNAPSFYLSDEMFTLNRERALEFCQGYKKRINKPFMIQTRIDSICDEELVKALKEAKCFMVNLAVESGNDYLRNEILKKNTPRDKIIEAFKLMKDYDIQTTSFNMIGIPGETKETLYETININREIKPDRILCTILMPLPGTELGKHCKENNLLRRPLEETTNYYSQVTIKNEFIPERTLIGYQGFFDWYVLLPKGSYPLIHFLRFIYQVLVSPKLPTNPFLYQLRESIVEFVYQSKKYLPDKTIHVKNR